MKRNLMKITISIALAVLFLVSGVTIECEENDNQLPEITILYPSYGQEPAYLNVSGIAFDTNGIIEWVEVSLNGKDWWTANGTTNWYFNISKISGFIDVKYTLYARSYNGKNYSKIESVIFPIGNIPPRCWIISPLLNQTVKGLVEIFGTASDFNGNDTIILVEISIDKDWFVVYGTTNWTYLWNSTKVPDGIYNITAFAYDEAGESSWIYPLRTIYVKNNEESNDTKGFELLVILISLSFLILFRKRIKSFT
ncbi:MAG: hypothetical protein DRN27_06655 [Thermoplasmata archaeon]|nr:MAG: hypothetical protein DRN27_06655 [Thermoplasmata archaeon]